MISFHLLFERFSYSTFCLEIFEKRAFIQLLRRLADKWITSEVLLHLSWIYWWQLFAHFFLWIQYNAFIRHIYSNEVHFKHSFFNIFWPAAFSCVVYYNTTHSNGKRTRRCELAIYLQVVDLRWQREVRGSGFIQRQTDKARSLLPDRKKNARNSAHDPFWPRIRPRLLRTRMSKMGCIYISFVIFASLST